ncbi:MAG: Ig domain-containing protein [Oscillospiraceae bacterium]|nr:Ig domain-containing protein [Oscillospiraceae bacterium]
MKRIVALFLSFLLAFGGIPVYAEETAVALSKSEIEAGEEVTLTFTYPKDVGNVLYAGVNVVYDAENFVLKSGPSGWTTDDSNGVAAANYLPSDVEAGEDFSEKSVEFVFTANSSAKAGSYEFTVGYQAVDTNNDIHEANGIKATLNIKTAEIAVESVSLNKTSLSLEEGASETLTATVFPENATDKTVTWESSDKEIATVEEGVVTAVKAGSATITAKSGEKEAKCEVTVTAKVVSEPFSYTISDIPSNGDNWAKLDSLVISGETGKVIGHSWNGFSLIVMLDKSTPDDAVINSKANTSGMRPTLSGAGDITLENGTAKQSLKLSSSFGDICKVDILYTKDNAPVIADGKDSEITAVIAFGESYEADVSNIFTDEDGDELSYQVKVDDGAYENFGGSKYIYKSEVAGEHVLNFRAYDGVLYSEGTYTVKLKIENSKTTYDVNVTVPDGISPKFYAVNTVKNGAVVKGDELAFENGKVKVPENITRIMWEADGFAGMSASVSAGANLELVKTEFEAQDYFGKADTAATIEITDPEGVKISGKTADTYLLPAVSGFTYKVTAGVSGYSPVELTEQTPTSGKVEIKLVLIHFSVIAPKGSVVSAGTLTGSFAYSFKEPIVIETEGETAVYKFAPLSGQNTFIRVQRPDDPDAVTYWDWKSSKADKQTITITEEMLFMNDSGEDKFDSDTVYRNFEKFAMDLGDIYMNINNQGYVNLNVGDVKGLNMFRNWQAIESFTNARISLPDFKYEIINLEGNDVISIKPDKFNSASATLTAKGEGTAIVLVTYDAMYSDSTVANSNGDAGGGNRYTAIWPDRTGVFVVSVGKDGTAVKSNMTCNGAVFDAEHSPQFYIGNEGASVSFVPDEGVTVTVNRSTVGKETLSFKEFTSEGVTVDSETGKVTVSGLKTGRHIIKFEKDGVASYQVVTAQQVTVDIVRSDGTELGLDSTIAPGTALTLKIKGLTNPAEKFATKYNFNAQVTYKDEKGNTYKNSSGAAFGKYDFSSLEQIVNVTVPSDWEGETITFNGYIQMGGFSGGAIGDHRKVSYGTSSGMATGSGAGMVLGTLPELVLNIGNVKATSISLDKTSVRAEADEPFALTATVLPENSTDVVEWISADQTIATVKDGVVTGQSTGKTTITAKVGDLTAVCTVEVYGTKKEIDVNTTPTANKYYFTDVRIKGVRGTVEKSEGTTHTILLDPRTKTTDTLDFVMTANRINSSRYFWVNNNKLQTSAGNPGTISVVPDWNENNEAVVTIRIANNSGSSNYDGPHTLNLKIAPHDHDSENEVADVKYLKSEATCTEKAVYWKSCSVCGLASDSETFKFGEINSDAHEWDEGKVTTEPTCSEAGVKTFTCKHDAQHTRTEEVAVDENAHNWGEAEYTWAEDGSSCTATRVCKNDGNHKETANATEIKSATTKEPTCEEKGETEYTAIFDVDWAAKQTKTVADISEKGHDWGEAEYTWAKDASSCEAKRVCKNDEKHVETVKAKTVTGQVAEEPTCVTKGVTQYTAIFEEDWTENQYTSLSDIEIDKNAHEWDEWKVVIEPDYVNEGLEKRVCKLSDEHFEEKAIEKLVPTATEKTEGPDSTKQYVVAYQEGVVMVPAGLENEYPNPQAVKDALKAKVENGDLEGEVNLVFREVTVGYYENGAFVPVSNSEFFENGRTIDIILKYPEGADENDKFAVYHLRDDGVIEKCEIKSKTDDGLVIEVGSLSPFAIAYESVDNAPNRPSLPDFPVFGRPSTGNGITIITPEDEKEEANPHTGAPVVCSFDLTAAGVVVLAATATFLKIKRKK